MTTTLRALIVEDSEDDALLVVRELEKGGYIVKSQRVDTPKEMSAALQKQTWDIVISDYRMPQFSGPDAMNLLHQTGLDVPFILVSGKIGEETAVELMLAGADDYVVKTNLKRLVPAVQRELREAEIHRERKLAEEQIVNQATFPHEDPNPVLRVSREGIVIFNNKASTPLLLVWQSSMGKPIPQDWRRLVENVYKTQTNQTAEIDYQGHTYLLNIAAVTDRHYVNIYGTDITNLKKAHARIQYLNQILSTIRRVNGLITTVDDENDLLQQACDILADGRNYSLAHVGLIQEGSYDLLWVGQSNYDRSVLDDDKVAWDDSEYGRGPVGTAIKTGKPDIIRDVKTDKRYRVWENALKKYGFNSICALPLTIDEKVIGALVIHSTADNVFDDEETELLLELAGDMSLGIQNIRQHDEIKQTKEKYANLVENSNDGIVILQDAKVKFSSAHMDRLTGFTQAEYMEKPFLDFISPAYREMVIEKYKKRMAGQEIPNRYEIELLTKANKSIPVEINVSIIEHQGRPAEMAVVRDITERKKAEKALSDEATRWRILVEQSIDGIVILNQEGGVYKSNKRFADMLGYSPEEVSRLHAWDWDTQWKRDELLEMVRNVGEKGDHFETEHRRKDGSVYDVAISTNGALVSGQKLVFCICRDITEHKKAEKELNNREAFLEAVLEQTPNALWLCDNKGTVTRMNKALRDLLQITDEEIIGKYNVFKDVQVAEQGYMPLVKTVFSDGKTINFTLDYYTEKEEQVKLEKTTHKMIDIVMSPIKNERGEILNVICQQKDITAQKEAQAALAESEARYRAIFEEAIDGIALIDIETALFVNCNPAYEKLAGRTLEQMRKLKLWEIRPPEQIEDVKWFISAIKDNETEYIKEIAFQKPDGTVTPVESKANIITLNGKKYIQSIARDITERKRAEEEIVLQAQLLDSAMDAVIVHNQSTDIIYVNQAAYKHFGYSKEELLKMKLSQIVAPEYRQLVPSRAKEAFKKGHGIFESAHMSKDGSIIPVEVSSNVIELGGQKLALTGIRNITERKLAEVKLKESYEKLHNTLDGVITAMAATIEFRDPYTAGHQHRTAMLARAIAREMGLQQEQIEGIYTAGLIHDVGKIGLPSDILSKPGKLSQLEFSFIKAHPQIGYDVIENIDFPYPVAQWILQHHERIDGSGYPAGLSGDKISLEAKVLAVADVVEAMSSHRPYRVALGIDKALEEIKDKRGILYDNIVVDACLKLFAENRFMFD